VSSENLLQPSRVNTGGGFGFSALAGGVRPGVMEHWFEKEIDGNLPLSYLLTLECRAVIML
jgi:hypothetical protein